MNIETLRYYERRGLLADPERSPGGHRLYPPEAVTVLRVIKAAQRLGFTLDEVADLLELGRHRHGKRVDAGLQRRARAKLVEVDERIADLVAIRANLRAALDAGCDDLVACATAECCPSRSRPSPSIPTASAPGRPWRASDEPIREPAPGRRSGCRLCGVLRCPCGRLLGVAGFAATAVTLLFAGVVFAVVVGVATIAAVLVHRSRKRRASCAVPASSGALPMELGPTRTGEVG